MRESCVTHRAKERYVQLREDYIGLMDGDYCGAAILALIEFWANGKLSEKDYPGDRIPLGKRTAEDWVEGTLGLYKRRMIMQTIKEFTTCGFLLSQGINGKTPEYWANIDAIQTSLDQYLERGRPKPLQNCKGVKNATPAKLQGTPLQNCKGSEVEPLQNCNASIYKKDLKESNSYVSKANTHTEAAAVVVEVLSPEECDREDLPNSLQLPPSDLKEFNHSTGQESLDPVEGKCSEAARDNKATEVKRPKFLVSTKRVDTLEELYNDGDELGECTQAELQALADRVMGEQVYLYRRKTRKILGQHVNDIDPTFLKFFAWRYWDNEEEAKRACDTIRSYEKDPSKWQALHLAVTEWQECLSNPERFKEQALRRANSKRGTFSQVDQDVATQERIERLRKVKEQQEKEDAAKAARKAAEEAEKVKASEVRSEPATASPSPQQEHDYSPEGTKAAREKARAEVDAIAARNAQRQQEQRRRA